jgi:superfamily II DNA helicase RecQ
MQLRFFTIPILGGESAAAELNRFLASHRVLAVDRQLAQDGGAALWTICVSYEPAGAAGAADGAGPKRGKVDYKELLSEVDFAVYAELRSLRKTLAERDGVPVYNLFTNEQLAAMVTRPVQSLAGLQAIPGVGAARIEKYGQLFLDELAKARRDSASATSGPGDPNAS